MNIVFYIIIILLIILTMYFMYRYNSSKAEPFDANNNHFRIGSQLTGMSQLEMEYFWNRKDKNGENLFDKIYESIGHLRPTTRYVDGMLSREDTATMFGPYQITLSQKKYPPLHQYMYMY